MAGGELALRIVRFVGGLEPDEGGRAPLPGATARTTASPLAHSQAAGDRARLGLGSRPLRMEATGGAQWPGGRS